MIALAVIVLVAWAVTVSAAAASPKRQSGPIAGVAIVLSWALAIAVLVQQ